jgi:hypothetical protein
VRRISYVAKTLKFFENYVADISYVANKGTYVVKKKKPGFY